jgi:predicted DNA-binding transcriptional regulator YafY
MSRAGDAQKAERLNLAWELLRHAEVPEVAAKLVQRCNISKRQAYRYLQMAQEMTAPMPIGDAKIPFTVKLSQSLVQRLHQYATTTGLTLSEIVSRALMTVLPRGRGRGSERRGSEPSLGVSV